MLACLSLVAFACNGDDDGGDGGDASSREEQEALLNAMVLTENDLPDGLASTGADFSTNEEAAQNANNPVSALRQFETWGRQLGLSVSFVLDAQASGPQTYLGVQSDATVHDDAQGCAFSYADLLETAEGADWAATLAGYGDVQVSNPDASGIGDEAYWVHITGVTPDGTKLWVEDHVIFRSGSARGFLRTQAQFLPDVARNSGEGQVLLWAQTMASRMEEAITA